MKKFIPLLALILTSTTTFAAPTVVTLELCKKDIKGLVIAIVTELERKEGFSEPGNLYVTQFKVKTTCEARAVDAGEFTAAEMEALVAKADATAQTECSLEKLGYVPTTGEQNFCELTIFSRLLKK